MSVNDNKLDVKSMSAVIKVHRRLEQNRKAAQAFRERHKTYIKSLEATIIKQQQSINALKSVDVPTEIQRLTATNAALVAVNSKLKSDLACVYDQLTEVQIQNNILTQRLHELF